MSLTLDQAIVPAALLALNNLKAVLGKAAAHAETQSFDANVLLQARLFPDMLPLTLQVQMATDMARRGVERLAGLEPASQADLEATFEALNERIEFSIQCINDIDTAEIANAESRVVEVQAGPQLLKMTASNYALLFMLPNLHFHVTTAYNILRHNGVALGKFDYLGAIPLLKDS